MSNLTELKIYLTHDKILLTNDRGFRVECNVPIPGNIVAITVGERSFHFGMYPPNPPSSPSTSDPESQSDPPSRDSPTTPGVGGGPEDPIEI